MRLRYVLIMFCDWRRLKRELLFSAFYTEYFAAGLGRRLVLTNYLVTPSFDVVSRNGTRLRFYAKGQPFVV